MRYLYVLLIAALLLGSQPAMLAQASAPGAPAMAATSVTIAGSLQSELGCLGNWDPACAATHLTFDASDQVWQATFAVPTGSWEYKAAINDAWDENYGANAAPGGTNIALNLASSTNVKFYYSDETHWVTDNVNSTIATAVGDFQSELGGCSDWSPDCLRSWMQDPDGDGIYTFSTTAIPAGSYEGKVATGESWSNPNYPVANILFTVPSNGENVTFTYNSSNNAVSIKVGSDASLDNDIWFDSLGHNSRDPLYRNPGGAVSAATPITLRLRAASGDLQQAQVRVYNDRTNASSLLNMTRVASGVALANDPGPYEFWEVTLPASPDPTVYWYRFIAKDGTKTAFYEDDSKRTGGWGQAFAASADNSYQLSIYDPAFTTPDWVKNAVIYQVFPDRFRDGDSDNNPAAGEFFYGNVDTTIFRSNGTEWNTPICDPRARPGAVAACEGKYSNNFYGGDLQGITEKIVDGYFADLGVTVLYLNPIFKSPSNHKYDTTDYGQIDPHFGTLADFEALVDAANAKNMHIVLDGVFNHVSSDSPYLDRYGRYSEVGACESETSPYRDWFYFIPAVPAGSGPCVGDDGTPGGADYDSWWGYDSLPKLRANTPQVRELIWDNTPGSPTAGIARYWIDQGASGWRLDVGGDVDPGTINDPTNDYWEGFRDAVHASDPEGYIVGEEWGNAISWNLGGEWDATMNYQQSAAILSFWRDTAFNDNDFNSGSSAGALTPITAEEINERLLNLQERYPPEAFAAMMNLFGSHDTNRALFLLNHDASSNSTALYADPAYDWSDSITRLKGAALIQMTMPGAPTIYYGDEIGLVGPPSFDGSQWQDDPYNRQPYPWLDETGTPFYTHLQTGGARANLLAYYQTLTSARNSTPALRTGSLDPLWTANGSPVYVYGRKMADDSSAAIVAANKDDAAQTITVNVAGYLPAGATLSDALSSATFTVAANGDLVLTNIPAQGGYLLVLDTSFTRPAAPNLTSAAAVSGKVTLAWDAVTGADSYDVYRSVLSGGAYELLGNVAALTYEDTTVTNGKSYYYVIKAKTASLLESEFSNERSALPAYTVGWANLQWPITISAVRSLVTPSENIYGQIWIDGATGSSATALPSVTAQVGYGNNGTLPTDASWRWFDASFNANVGNNDEYVGNLVLDAPAGAYDYLYRYSTDGGVSWVYGLNNGLINSDLSGYNPANAGQLTLLADTVNTAAPDAPTNLALTGTTTSSISLEWDAHPDTDGDLYGFEIWRRNLPAGTFARIDLLANPAATSYTDTNVIANDQYEYYITAIDEAVNTSIASNIITATAEMRMVDVTFSVTVPDPTPGTIYIAGGFSDPLPAWNAGGIVLTDMGSGNWQVTLSLLDGANIEYKYARGNWETVEKEADGNTEITNRSLTVDYGIDGTQTVNDTVANWRDPFVTGFSPADGAIDQPTSAVITAAWNQAMPDLLNPAACFSITGPGGAVAGSVTYDSTDKEYTFTPASVLDGGLHTVNITGCKDVAGDTQQVAQSWSFTVIDEIAPAAPVVTTPADGSLTSDSTPTVSGTAEANSTVKVYFDAILSGSANADSAGIWEYTPASALGNGLHTVYATATDAANNTSPISNTNTFTVGNAPSNISLSNASVEEGQPVGTFVGSFSTADLDTGEAFTYSLVAGVGDSDNAAFTIDGAALKTAQSFDFSLKNSYSIRVRSTDSASLSFEKAFTISILEVAPPNQAPTDISLSNASVAEGLPAGTVVGNLSSSDPNAGDTFTYALVAGVGDSDNAAFTINGAALKTAQPFNYLAKNSYSVRIRTTDSGSLSFEKAFAISITDSGAIFADVPDTFWAASWIERLYNAGITGGCGISPLIYCPDSPVTREQMAVFLLKSMHGSGYKPPEATGLVFADVPLSSIYAPWIEQLAAEGITAGCGNDNYCPTATVTRDQMAVFLLKARHGTAFSPPDATGIFDDVPGTYWAADWIEQLAAEGITAGCGGGNYCPENNVTRAEMAVFLVKTFNLP